MNKKEISEIKKLLSPANCAITRICGCYVDAEKNQRMKMKEAFLSLPEEVMFKYFNIFRKSLSGSINKNIMNMEFLPEQEAVGGTQEFLLKIRDSELKNDELIEEFYERVMETYICGGNYYIILVYGSYDIPGRASDNLDIDDASDYVYNFIQCSICPVKLSKPGLHYNSEINHMENSIPDWMVDVPDAGFLFPAFNDRNADIHNLIYYAKNPEVLQTDFIDQLLGCSSPLSAKTQKETFQYLIEETLGDTCDYETVMNIHEKLNELITEHKEDPEPVTLGGQEIKKLFENSGVKNEKLAEFDAHYEALAGEETSFAATNLMDIRCNEIKTRDITVKLTPDNVQKARCRIIDDVPCLVVELTDVLELNGIEVKY